jgi:hypothetical protein
VIAAPYIAAASAVLGGIAFLGLGYLAACAAAERWLTLREWWG